MNIIAFCSSPALTNYISNTLSEDHVVQSTNPNGFINSDYDLIMVEDRLLTDSLFEQGLPVLLITHLNYGLREIENMMRMVGDRHIRVNYIFKPIVEVELHEKVRDLVS